MRGPFCAAGAPDEKNHYHNDTSNYTVIRKPLRLAVLQGALPLDNMIQETGAAREAFNPFSRCSTTGALNIELQNS